MKKRVWTAEEKMAIVMEGLKGDTSIAEVCRKHGIHQGQYYRWRDLFLEGGRKALENGKVGEDRKALEEKLKEYERIIGKQAVQLEILKKSLNLEK